MSSTRPPLSHVQAPAISVPRDLAREAAELLRRLGEEEITRGQAHRAARLIEASCRLEGSIEAADVIAGVEAASVAKARRERAAEVHIFDGYPSGGGTPWDPSSVEEVLSLLDPGRIGDVRAIAEAAAETARRVGLEDYPRGAVVSVWDGFTTATARVWEDEEAGAEAAAGEELEDELPACAHESETAGAGAFCRHCGETLA